MTEALLSRPTVVASQFLRRAATWWLAELADMAPPVLRRPADRLLGRTMPDDAVLDLSGTRPSLLLQQRGRPAPLSIPVDEPAAEARSRVGALMRRHRSPDAVTIRLDPGQLFVTTLDLPRAAERSLDAVLRHQIEHLVPLPAARMRFAYRILPRPANVPTLKVAVAVARLSTIDQALALARGLGLTPRHIVAAVVEAGPAPLVFWQTDHARTVTPARRWLYRALEATAVVLALAAYGLHIHGLDQTRDALREAVSQATREAAGTRELSQRVAQSADALAFLRMRRQEPKPLEVLDSLTTLLPLDTWASDLTLRRRSVEIVGAAPHATDLIALIEGSPMFGRAQFRSPITLLPDGHAERFDLTFDVKTDQPR